MSQPPGMGRGPALRPVGRRKRLPHPAAEFAASLENGGVSGYAGNNRRQKTIVCSTGKQQRAGLFMNFALDACLAFVFGLLAGSFLNVCIHRWPRGRSVVRPRSHCVRCRKTIAWYDNIPLASYLILGGKCRYCHRKISPRYPAVELITGLLFFYFVETAGLTLAALKMCVFTAMLVGLLFSDLEKRILPDQFTLGGTAIGLIFSAFVPIPDHTAQMMLWLFGFNVAGALQSIAESVLGAALPAFVLWGGGWLYFKIRHREGLGFGDVKLVAMAGAFLGLEGALLTLILGSIAGSILGYGYIKIAGKDTSTYELPFGTFLGAAGLFVALAGHRILTSGGAS
jgi:leader peptidase (prepilin peptidase)/N-methyltransferase